MSQIQSYCMYSDFNAHYTRLKFIAGIKPVNYETVKSLLGGMDSIFFTLVYHKRSYQAYMLK